MGIRHVEMLVGKERLDKFMEESKEAIREVAGDDFDSVWENNKEAIRKKYGEQFAEQEKDQTWVEKNKEANRKLEEFMGVGEKKLALLGQDYVEAVAREPEVLLMHDGSGAEYFE